MPQTENEPQSLYAEDQLLSISALQHLMFCERQCALIHIEQLWDENRLTVEGKILHERVHESGNEVRNDVRIVRGLKLRSLRLGLVGVADVVEFHKDLRSEISNLKSGTIPFPVEYKRGRPKPNVCDEVQLCAQAMCIEEMMGCHVNAGAIFYGQPRRRLEVPMSPELRQTTESTAARLHTMIEQGVTPPAVFEKKCKQCSLLSLCMPETAGQGKSAARYLKHALNLKSEIPELSL